MPAKFMSRFLKLESAGGIVLFCAAILALLLSNSPLSYWYTGLLESTIGGTIAGVTFTKSLAVWVNDGLMAVFFLLVGLEIKRECLVGELNSLSKMMLPAIAAVGGMAVPALIYVLVNWGDSSALQGWAIPAATDIAFALGVLSLLANRVPISLKILLTAIAVIDDLGAIFIIAAFYTDNVSAVSLGLSGISLCVLAFMNWIGVTRQEAFIFVGFILWLCVLKSGVHATLAGVAIAFSIPMRSAAHDAHSPLVQLESRLLPWVSFLVLPVFAFTNAGISFSGLSTDHLFSGIPLGIILGLLLGKQFGIFSACFAAVKMGIAKLPSDISWLGVYGLSVLCGVGFTMSLFIGSLAFDHPSEGMDVLVRLGVLCGSSVAGVMGYLVLRFVKISR